MRPVVCGAVVLALGLAPIAVAQDFAALYRAAEALRSAPQPDPDKVRAAYVAAVAAFGKLAADAPERAAALPAAAFAALQAGMPAPAAAWIAESIALGHDDALHAEIEVQALALSGQARAAVAAVHARSLRHPEAVERALASVQAQAGGALCEAADVAMREGQTEVGLSTFALFVKASQRHPVTLANLALALRHVGRDAEAEARYREALAAAPDDPDLWNDLGLLLKGQLRDAEAVAAFAKSRALDAQAQPAQTQPSGPAISNLAMMMRAGRIADPAARLPDATAALAGVLARVPQAAMARRLLLQELLDASFPPRRADSQRPPR